MNNNKLLVKFPWKFRTRQSIKSTGALSELGQTDTPTTVDNAVQRPWTLRPRKLVNEGASSSITSRSANFNRQIRDGFPERYDAFKTKDALRQRKKYVPIQLQSARKKKEMREKWKIAKRSVRGTQTINNCSETRKGMKEKTLEERRENARLRQQKCRLNASIQKKRASKELDRRRKVTTESSGNDEVIETITIPTLTRTTMQRRVRVVKQILPSTPKSFAAVVAKVITAATPRKRDALANAGVRARRSLEDELVFKGIKETISNVKKCPRTSANVKMAKMLLQAATAATNKRRRMTQFLGASKRLLHSANELRQPRKNCVVNNEETKELVAAYWMSEEVSRCLPLKKRVKKGKPMYLLEMTYMRAFTSFKAMNPNIKIGYVTFIKLKPTNVRHMKSAERIVCVCIKCENAALKLQALNRMMIQIPCISVNLRIPTLQAMSDLTLCGYTDQPKKECIDRCCSKCGTFNVREWYKPLTSAETVANFKGRYDSWEYKKEKRMCKSGEKVINVMGRQTNACTLTALVNLVVYDLESLGSHLFRAAWQQRQFAGFKTNIPPQSAVVVMDFAENYACSMQDEVQSYHWCQQQATVHPVMAYINASTTERGIVTHRVGSESEVFVLCHKCVLSKTTIASCVNFLQ